MSENYTLDILGAGINVSRATGETDDDYCARLCLHLKTRTSHGSQFDLTESLFRIRGVKRVDVLKAPPGYVHVRVHGDEDRLIAWTLYNGLPAFVGTKGNTSHVIDCDVTGKLHRIRFSRPRWYHLAWWWVCGQVKKVTK